MGLYAATVMLTILRPTSTTMMTSSPFPGGIWTSHSTSVLLAQLFLLFWLRVSPFRHMCYPQRRVTTSWRILSTPNWDRLKF